ncbi:MAG: pyridoxal phosphate-dependent aminotransferase [bacterium]
MTQQNVFLSQMASGLIGSEILKVAAEIRAKIARGDRVINLTVGDFRPDLFPIPKSLKDGIVAALERGETNYPPSDGILDLRKAVTEFYAERLGLDYPVASVVIAGGVRPALYAVYRTLLSPGETLLYPVPSWNNNHYAWLVGAKRDEVIARAESNFLPTAEDLRPRIASARVLLLNSPLNPAGTAYEEAELERIVALILDENARREGRGEAPVVLLYDQVYWMLTFGGVRHVTPVAIDARMREYTLFVDGISKAFCATGIRVGWCVGPEHTIEPISSLLGHIGAWAPRAEQVATATFLRDGATMDAFLTPMKAAVEERLQALHEGFTRMRADGYPVECIAPQGAIYLSARVNIIGKRAGGKLLSTNEEIRVFLLERAAVAVVPFQAFGLREESGWFRLSVGALPTSEIAGLFPALRAALDEVSA